MASYKVKYGKKLRLVNKYLRELNRLRKEVFKYRDDAQKYKDWWHQAERELRELKEGVGKAA